MTTHWWSSHRANCVCEENSLRIDRDAWRILVCSTARNLCTRYVPNKNLHDWENFSENYSRLRQILVENPYLVFVGGVFDQSGQYGQNQSLRCEVGKHFWIEQDVVFVAFQANSVAAGLNVTLVYKYVSRFALKKSSHRIELLNNNTCGSASPVGLASFALGTLLDR